jgi:hypothetical protein
MLPRVGHGTLDATEVVQKLAFQSGRKVVSTQHYCIDLHEKRGQPLLILIERYGLHQEADIFRYQLPCPIWHHGRERNLPNGRDSHAFCW